MGTRLRWAEAFARTVILYDPGGWWAIRCYASRLRGCVGLRGDRQFGLLKMVGQSLFVFAMARPKFEGGRVGEVEHAADIQVGAAGCRGACAARVLEADIPALLRKGALEALGGQLDFERDIMTIRKHGVNAPPSVKWGITS